MSLKGFKEKSTVPWFLSIFTPLMNPTPDGLTTSGEASDLNGWEDAIEAIIKGAGRFVYVGRATWNGHREILYYVDGQGIVTKKLNGVIATHSMRPFAFRCERDDKWENVSIYFKQQ